MKLNELIISYLPWILFLAVAVPAYGEESRSVEATSGFKIKSQKGLQFNVPEDWPIEEKNGAVGPIPVEDYMARKFEAMERRIIDLEGAVKDYDDRIRALEKERDSQLRSIPQKT